MLRRSVGVALALLVLAGFALAADKEVTCTLIKVDADKNIMTVKTEDGTKHDYEVNDNTKFIGPRGGLSDRAIKDDRLIKGVKLTLVIAGNNRTVREVRIPEKNAKDK
jgi:hypothetical protein